MLFVGAAGAFLVFRSCQREQKNAIDKKKNVVDELRKHYRLLTVFAECFGMVALFSVAMLFGRTMLTQDKEELNASREFYSDEAREVSWKIQRIHCLNREKDGVTLAFKSNFNPICSATNSSTWFNQDASKIENRLADIERASILRTPAYLLSSLDELKLSLNRLRETENKLTQRHGSWIPTAPGTTSLVLLALAVFCALCSSTIKTGKACHEWYAGRDK